MNNNIDNKMLLTVEGLNVSINGKPIVKDLSFAIPEGKISVIIGPNGCGKSTTLKAIARIIPCSGKIEYLGKEVRSFGKKEFARTLAVLTQSPQAPTDLTVGDLVEMGRFPYRSLFGGSKPEDAQQVAWALQETNMTEMRNRLLSTLSGGERQRAWIAMALAQRPQLLFLDEPTTYLDICHQLEVMQLLVKLNRELGLTVVMVLHDLNQALQYCEHVVVIKEGQLVATGEAKAIINTQLLKDVFRVRAEAVSCSEGLQALVPVGLEKP